MVELMIALVISSLLVGMILSIFTRMSTAYRTQQHVAELQLVLTSAQHVIHGDLRQAGYQLPDGFRVKGPPGVHPAVEIRDDASGFGPDELRVFYADASALAQATVDTTAATPFTSFTVDAVDNFVPGDVVVLTKNYTTDVNVAPSGATVARFEACVVQIQQIAGTTFWLATAGDWGEANNDACDQLRTSGGANPTMVYRFKARAYRIDDTRRSLAVLQMSPSGGLVRNDWQDLGVGFTDLQVASRWYEGEDVDGSDAVDTADVDADPLRDWYSGAEQDVQSEFVALPTFDDNPITTRALLMEVRVSIAVRTTRRLDTVGAAQTPAFIDPARPDNNDVGNRDTVVLSGVPDAARPEELRGDHLYRYASVGSDTRNLAVGR